MRRFFYTVVAASLLASGMFAQDPPSRIARLNHIEGNVSIQPAGLNDWAPAELNRPFTTGDTAYADAQSRAEFHLDTAIVRAGEYTSFGFLTLNDQAVQLRLTQGDLYVNLRYLDPDQTFEVDTPNAAVSLLRAGIYRFRIASNGSMTFVVVRQGQAEITGNGQPVNVTPGNSASISNSGEQGYEQPAPEPDDFDLWSQDRDARERRYESRRYVPSGVIGAEDLEQYGGWQSDPNYGQVWYPTRVAAGWAPYRDGHWAWIEPWGWTWIDDEPWGFAPFHYGRWAYVGDRWGWCPGPGGRYGGYGPSIERAIYAPALVAWFGGSHFGVGFSVGGPSVGWVPLGYGELYTPSYQCSPGYFNRVNVSNTTIVNNVNMTNVYNTVYVNKTVYNQRYVNAQAPNAVTAMNQNSFANGRSVAQAGTVIAPRQMQSFQPQAAALVSPPVAPTRQALVATNTNRPVVARPTPQVVDRRVVVRNTPAVQPAPFADRQAYLQQHAGQPHDFVAMHQQVAPSRPPTPQYTKVSPANTAPRPSAGQPVPPQYSRFPAPPPAPRTAVPQPAQPQYNGAPPVNPGTRTVPPPSPQPQYNRMPPDNRVPPQYPGPRTTTPPPPQYNRVPPPSADKPAAPPPQYNRVPPPQQQPQYNRVPNENPAPRTIPPSPQYNRVPQPPPAERPAPPPPQYNRVPPPQQQPQYNRPPNPPPAERPAPPPPQYNRVPPPPPPERQAPPTYRPAPEPQQPRNYPTHEPPPERAPRAPERPPDKPADKPHQ